MKKSMIVALALLLISFLVLSACSGGNSDTTANAFSTGPNNASPSPDASASNAATPPPEASPAGAAPDDAGTKYKGDIVVSIVGNEDNMSGVEALKAAYKKVQPDVNIVWENPPDGDYTTWLGTQLAAGNPRPDVVSGNYEGDYDKYVNFDKYRSSDNPYTGDKWDEDLDFDFLESRNNKGERTMIATQGVDVLWYYNKDVFDKLGLKPPTNWDEFVAVCKAIKDAGTTPMGIYFGNTPDGGQVTSWLWQYYIDQYTRDWRNIVRAQPSDWNYDPEKDAAYKYDPADPFNDRKYTYNQTRFYKGLKDGTISFDTPGVAELVKNLSEVFPQYANQEFYNANGSPYDLWLQQKVAMMMSTTGTLVQATNDMKNLNDPKLLERMKRTDGGLAPFQWSTFTIPGMTGENVKGPVRTSESAVGQYISIIDKGQEHTDMVLDFLKFWLSKPGYQAFVDGMTADNTFNPGGPIKIKGVEIPAEYQKMFDAVKQIGGAGTPLNYDVLQLFDGASPEITMDSKQLLMDAFAKKITPEQFAQKYQGLWDKHFGDLLKSAGLTEDDLEHPERMPAD